MDKRISYREGSCVADWGINNTFVKVKFAAQNIRTRVLKISTKVSQKEHTINQLWDSCITKWSQPEIYGT